VFNPKLRGWIQYYGKFRSSALFGISNMFQKILVKNGRETNSSAESAELHVEDFTKNALDVRSLGAGTVHKGWCDKSRMTETVTYGTVRG
jgi:hypothetical protein